MKKNRERLMNAKTVAESIAGGHAYQKHVEEGNEFPDIESRDDFAGLIEEIVRNPSERKKLTREREAFWNEAIRAVVIFDPNSPDFPPLRARISFRNGLCSEARESILR